MQKWIATTGAQWQAVFKRDVTDVHETELNKLKLQYLTSLETAIAKASAAGDLDGALALRNEQKRFAETNVFPEQDDAADASVKQLRAAIRAQLAPLEKDSAARAKALHAKYDPVLAQAQAQLTQRGRLDDALLVKAKRGEVASAWLAGIPAPIPQDVKPAPATGPARANNGDRVTVNLLPLIDPAKDTIAGQWTLDKGALVSSGKGEERIEIPYEPPNEYDFKVSYTKTGTNCVIQILSHEGAPFIWVMSTSGKFTFHYLKGAGLGANKTTVHQAGLKNGHKYTSIVRVRNKSVEAILDGKTISKWETDYSDATPAQFWALRNRRLLGIGTGDTKTVFHSIEVIEIGPKGKPTR